MIVNFGLRGSTFPNMVEERAMACIAHIRTLLRSELDIDSKIGATYGKAYCGVVTKGDRTEYTVMGPAVNLAARLMTHVRNPGVLVDEAVKLKAGKRPFTAIRPIEAKGYKDMVKIYIPEVARRNSWKKQCSSFVGREEEFALLLEVAESILHAPTPDTTSTNATNLTNQHISRMCFLSGSYGSGKSFLLSHVSQMVEDTCNLESMPYSIFRHVCCDEDSFKPFRYELRIAQGLADACFVSCPTD
mgnify:CR=1 FL=1